MQMADKDVPQTVHLEAHAGKLHLCAFAAVNHEKVVAEIDYLRARMMPESRFCRCTPQYRYLKFIHRYATFNYKFSISTAIFHLYGQKI